LFLNSWSLGAFGPVPISAADHLFTKQLLCQLSYAGIIQRVAQAHNGPTLNWRPLPKKAHTAAAAFQHENGSYPKNS
jgi:hypothetical protein